MIYWIYNILITLFLTLGLLLFPLAFLFGRRVWEGALERMAVYPQGLSESLRGFRPIWVHAVSVGEVRSAACLTRQIKAKYPDRKILLSTVTRAGKRMARQIDAGLDGVVYFPIDHPWIVRRALRLFDPSLLIFLETEIWPNVLRLAYGQGIPTLMLSGRVSPRAFRRYRVCGWFFSTVLKKFTSIGMQNEDNAERIIHLGADPEKVSITGNLKQAPGDGAFDGRKKGERDLVLDSTKARRVLVAGSTHRGEEEVLLDVFRFLKSRIPNLMLILAPRHPHRFAEVERLLQRKNVSYEKRSRLNGQLVTWPDVILLDTMGDLPAVYRLADVTFVGGSLVDAGGHNPMEPGRWGKPILFGPHMTNFSDIATEMKTKGGGIEVQDGEELIREITALLNDPQKALRMGKQAREVTGGDHSVVDRSMSLISPFI